MAGPDSLETLYEAHAGALFAYALNLTRSETDARTTTIIIPRGEE